MSRPGLSNDELEAQSLDLHGGSFVRSLRHHHNLMAHCAIARNPRLQGHVGTVKDVVDNVIYNSAHYGTGPPMA